MSIYVDNMPAWWTSVGERRATEWWAADAWRMEEAYDHGPVSAGTVVDGIRFIADEDLLFVAGKHSFETLEAGESVAWVIPDADDMAYIKKCHEYGHPRITVFWKGRKRFVPSDKLTRPS